LVVVEERVLEEVVIVGDKQTGKQTNWIHRLGLLLLVVTVLQLWRMSTTEGQMVLWGNNISVRPQALPCNEWPTIKKRKKKHNNNISQGLWLAVAHEFCPCCCCCSWDPFIFPSTSSSFMSSSSSLKNSFPSLLFACSSRLYVAPRPFLVMLQTS
jgi:hypothetical protein